MDYFLQLCMLFSYVWAETSYCLDTQSLSHIGWVCLGCRPSSTATESHLLIVGSVKAVTSLSVMQNEAETDQNMYHYFFGLGQTNQTTGVKMIFENVHHDCKVCSYKLI